MFRRNLLPHPWGYIVLQTYVVVTFRSLKGIHMLSNMYVCTTESMWNPNSQTLESDQPQNHRRDSCVIAQQYSSATLVSLCFHCHKEKSGARLKILLQCFIFLTLFRIACQKLRNLKLYGKHLHSVQEMVVAMSLLTLLTISQTIYCHIREDIQWSGIIRHFCVIFFFLLKTLLYWI